MLTWRVCASRHCLACTAANPAAGWLPTSRRLPEGSGKAAGCGCGIVHRKVARRRAGLPKRLQGSRAMGSGSQG